MFNLSENKLGQHVIALQKKSLSLQMVDTPKSGKKNLAVYYYFCS
jgi:hypothetical protein